ncbi:MAG: hypothetical protein IPK85_03355 [Gemmatimonadetes bacterium]|nr:hypothetical protein [Gemmatimonadota bacterium]
MSGFPNSNPKSREITPLLQNDPQVWVLMRAVMSVKERGEEEVLADIAEMVDRGMWESAHFWSVAVDNARSVNRAAHPERAIPDLELVLQTMAGALAAFKRVSK